MRRPTPPLLLLLALSLVAAPARAKAPAACAGTLSGEVKGAFSCTVSLAARGSRVVLAIETTGPVEGIPSVVPGAFELPEARPGTYTLDALGMGKASVAAEGGALYTATKTSSQRGEVTVTLRSVAASRKVPGTWDVHGTYRARLLPTSGGRTGEVVVEVTF